MPPRSRVQKSWEGRSPRGWPAWRPRPGPSNMVAMCRAQVAGSVVVGGDVLPPDASAFSVLASRVLIPTPPMRISTSGKAHCLRSKAHDEESHRGNRCGRGLYGPVMEPTRGVRGRSGLLLLAWRPMRLRGKSGEVLRWEPESHLPVLRPSEYAGGGENGRPCTRVSRVGQFLSSRLQPASTHDGGLHRLCAMLRSLTRVQHAETLDYRCGGASVGLCGHHCWVWPVLAA